MSERSRRRFAAAVRAEPVDLGLACLLIGAEVQPDLDVEAGLLALDRLAATARPDVPRDGTAAEQAEGLRVALGARAGFAGSAEDYADVRSSLLHEVLRRRRGLPILLSVVWLEVARRLEVPAFPVGLPGHFVVGVGDVRGAYVLVDPFAGGPPLPPPAEPVTSWPAVDVLLRVLANIRRLGAGSPHRLDVARTQLWAAELSLLLPRHPLELRRERGHLLVRLGEFGAGAAELDAYADAVQPADADVAALARRDAGLARARLN